MDWGKLLGRNRIENGRVAFTPDLSNGRNPFEKDFDRIAYSQPFRRLQNKTQVHTLPNNDHVRNRLTHSLEASTIARSLGLRVGGWLKDNTKEHVDPREIAACVQAATVAHDIGNTPFGHAGEEVIQEWFRREDTSERTKRLALSEKEKWDFCGFNGNAQGFRILTRAKTGYPGDGLQLTAAVLASFVKYPTCSDRNGKCGLFQGEGDLYEEIASYLGIPRLQHDHPRKWARHPLVYLVEAADDAAYLTADIEDGVELGLIALDEALKALGALSEFPDDGPPKVYASLSRYRARAIKGLIQRAFDQFVQSYEGIMLGAPMPALLTSERDSAVKTLRVLAEQKLFTAPAKLKWEIAGRQALEGLLKTFALTTCEFSQAGWNMDALCKQSPKDWRIIKLMQPAGVGETCSHPMSGYEALHRVTDFIAGQTDRFAVDLWRSLRGVKL